jgi:ribosomal protein S18 acetylase RimI-like enzyme
MTEVTSDKSRLDVDRVHAWIAASYWATGIPRDVMVRAIERSLCFGAFDDGVQVGFARVVTDATTFAYVCDVIVDEAHRGQGVGKALMTALMAHPDLQGLRRLGLVTHNAHALYEPFGFRSLAHPERHMEITRPGMYLQEPDGGTSGRGPG